MKRMKGSCAVRGAASLALGLLVAGPATAQESRSPAPDVGIEQRVGEYLPPALELRDESGLPIRLREATGGRATVLALVYYRCPMLCNLVLNGLLQTLLELPMDAGRDFNVVAVSFDPAEGADLARAKREQYLKSYGRPAGRSGWRFLTGDEENIRRLCRQAGFRVARDPATGQYAHGAALILLTPEARISRYLFGVNYPVRELRLSLVEAASGKIGTAVDQFLLLCMRYDPATGRYGLAVTRMLQVLATVTLLGLAAMIYRLSRGGRPAVVRSGIPAARVGGS